jgi:hypothetical protein
MSTLLSTPSPVLQKPRTPPPLWFVTNGDVTVGPVTTNLLLRGVVQERVPRDCLVRERKWAAWRELDRIREIAAIRRAQARGDYVWVEQTRWRVPPAEISPFERFARDLKAVRVPGAVLVDCLMEARKATGAWVGAVHRVRPPRAEYVTSGGFGPAIDRRLGRVIPAGDPALLLAAAGVSLCEEPTQGELSGIVQARLGSFPACSGVLMVPVVCFGRLYAAFELGRPDHAFRQVDQERAETIAAIAAETIGVVQNRS